MVDTIANLVAHAKPAKETMWVRIKARLVAVRYLLAVACAVVAWFVISDNLDITAAVVLIAILILTAAIAPMRTAGVRARERKAAAAAITPDLNSIARVLDAIPEPILILDRRATIRFANETSHQKIGHITLGQSALIRFRSPDVQEMLQEALAYGNPKPVQYLESHDQGTWFSAAIRRLDEPVGNLFYAMHFEDLTTLRATERMRSDFIANASHELRTPLASLSGFIETLAGPARNDAPARDRFLGIMAEQTQRMSRLVNDLLYLSRFETARGITDFKPVDLHDTLLHVINALRLVAEQAGIEIVFGSKGDYGEVCVNGNRDELIQLFENLIENAIKYGGDGKQVIIAIEAVKTGNQDAWRISVTDKGQGIARDHLPRLTERFYRVDVEASRVKQGTGLGLAIVKHITSRHRGLLTIESEIGHGTTVMVSLPKSTPMPI